MRHEFVVGFFAVFLVFSPSDKRNMCLASRLLNVFDLLPPILNMGSPKFQILKSAHNSFKRAKQSLIRP